MPYVFIPYNDAYVLFEVHKKRNKVKLEIKIALYPKRAQQSVHPTLGSLRHFQAFFNASAFFQSDGVPPPAPARVTQTVGCCLAE
jgi:hypothetical protein